MKKIPIIISLLLVLATSACSIHKLEVQQGNIITPDMLDELKIGMDKNRVRFILGTPPITDPFHHNRWDYPYVIRNGQDVIREAQVSLFFEGDLLRAIEGDYLPDWANPDSGSATDEAEGDSAPEDAEN